MRCGDGGGKTVCRDRRGQGAVGRGFGRQVGERFSVANDERGISELLRRLEPADLVIIEATGGLEVPVASALATAGIAVAVVNPRQVRDFARATGQLAKTDALDAQVLARFGEAVKPQVRALRGRAGPGARSAGKPPPPTG